MMADRIIRWSTAGAVVDGAAVAMVAFRPDAGKRTSSPQKGILDWLGLLRCGARPCPQQAQAST